jgi:hypothetical protein
LAWPALDSWFYICIWIKVVVFICHRNPSGEPICSLRFGNYQNRGRGGSLSCHRNPAGETSCSPRFVSCQYRGRAYLQLQRTFQLYV